MLMSGASVLRSLGNKVYQHAFPIYRPLYAAYKAYADRAERRLLKTILSTDDIVVDAGANIGIYSRFLSRCVGPTGVVHSFEPSPANFKRLQSVTRNLANVRLCQAAVGERSGRSKLYVSDKLNVDHRAYLPEGDSRHSVQIDITALDDYFKPGQRVDLIKIDIQGYELHALRGASRVVAENPDVKLLLELWPYGLRQAGVHWTDLIAALQRKAMIIRQVSAAGLVPFQPSSASENAEWYVNLFASRT
jgi:FkbM family methyltransferase